MSSFHVRYPDVTYTEVRKSVTQISVAQQVQKKKKKRNAFYTMSLHTCVLVKCPKAQAEVKQYGSKVRGACLVWSWVYFSDGGKKCLDRVRARRREELNKQEDDG